MKAQQLTRFTHSRWMLILVALAVVPSALLAYRSMPIDYIGGDRGLLYPSANLWITDHFVEMWVNIGVTFAMAALMIALNRTFNLLKTMTLLDSSLFLVMSMSTPWLLVQFHTGTVLTLTLLLCLFLLYSTYANPDGLKRVFLIFAILSAMSMTQYCYVVYMPVFIIGCAQMRIFGARTVSAIVLGIVTPWWIVLGSGLASVHDIHMPQMAALFNSFDIVENLGLVMAVLLSTALLLIGWTLHFPRMIAYNAHMRAYNGTLSVLALVTLIAICADFANISAYAPTLFMCSAFYISRMFASKQAPNSYMAILFIVFLYAMLYTGDIRALI